ncbi:GDP-mannose 4,6-dehydratase [Actinospongicola halichondriae]|uniref:GDP-mannose 4,6-dehydratase n=1 Tax=Actinospongicola halichondriae TaxID=3236844 RepID=UPI003D4F8B5A
MRALVTGSLGFAGTHLCAHLREQGDVVIGVDRDDADLTDPSAAERLLSSHQPEVVYHLAGAADVGASWRDPVGTWEANATASLYLLEAARTLGVRRVLLVSSADVYGAVQEEDLPLDESSPLRPTSPYAASKVAAEQVARQAWLGHGLETIRVRAFNHIGPGQRPDFVAPAIATAIAQNELSGSSEIAIGDLSPRRDFTDVRDVVRAYRLLMAHGSPGDVYCVCSGRAIAIQDLADTLVAMAEAPMHLRTDPDRLRPVDIPVLRGSNQKLQDTTGWTPAYSIDETLADLMAESRLRVRSDIATQNPRTTP